MKKISFNDNWLFQSSRNKGKQAVRIPHDAALAERRTEGSAGGVNTGWFEGADYIYEKQFDSSLIEAYAYAVLEFEGVYRNAEVYVNDRLVTYRPYGYTNFYVDLLPYLKEGKNTVKVLAKNADQPNSRWYSGAGIYRPVWLYLGHEKHILLNGVKVRTESFKDKIVSVKIETSCVGEAVLEILDEDRLLHTEKIFVQESAEARISLSDCMLWSCEHPKLYTLRVSFHEDIREINFGIRKIDCDAENGFCLNGERVILQGACVHSDNGILGACSYPEAEERKVRLLKEIGYNAIRCAHNPCSKSFLDACDRLGMLVMDEYVDMWYVHKTSHDYADYCEKWYEQDLRDMIDKDYNHPSVIMYSLGNEVGESSEEKGILFYEKMQTFCHQLDADRPVTCGVNILFNYMYSLGLGVYSDKKAKKNPSRKVGSEFFNTVAGIFGSHTMKVGATLQGCDQKTKGVFSKMDVAGYNYGILRYEKDLKKYPDRIILGTETFCSDVFQFLEIARENKRIIGDFVWAGIDYLGEVGVGAWEYKDYAPDFRHGLGWLCAGSGRLDLIGSKTGEALYTKTAYGAATQPQIAVVPVDHTFDRHSPSAWKYSNAIPSWSFEGCEGKYARVEVYANAHQVQIFINNESRGKKQIRKGRACFYIKYEPGVLKAVAYDKQGKVLGENTLCSAGEETLLSMIPEKNEVRQGELVFIKLCYTDQNGIRKPLARGRIRLEVSGGKLIGLGHACPYNEDGFLNNDTDTYYGEALAAVLAESELSVKAYSDYGTAAVRLPQAITQNRVKEKW